MKLAFHRKTEGSVLVVTLVTIGIIGLALVSYLTLASAQQKSTMRSQCWNTAIPVAEAGIEEGMAHLRQSGTTNLGSDSWTSAGNGNYTKRRDFNDSYSITTISNATTPVITGEGFVLLPLESATYISRKVRVIASRDALLGKGLVAKGQIDMNGNNVSTDSFDSADSLYSTNGLYSASKAKSRGDVATDSNLTNSLNVGNANIHGNLATGPGGSVSVGANGQVTGTISDDMNVQFDPVLPPFNGGYFTPSGGTVNGVNYNYVLDSGNYQLSSLSGKVLVRGNAVLWVTQSLSMSGQSSITIQSNKVLKLYVSAASASLGGNGVINQTGNATNFFYYGLPSNTSLSVSGNAGFTGVIYAPSAALSLNGGGNNTIDFIGAAIVGSATLNGHFNFHYDENLARVGPSRGYVITSWNEL